MRARTHLRATGHLATFPSRSRRFACEWPRTCGPVAYRRRARIAGAASEEVMKRIGRVFGVVVVVLSAAACSAASDGDESVSGDTSDLVSEADCLPAFRDRTDRLDRAAHQFE